jgi:uncharacterized membrane protein YdjX (TVP38/TMEM64 family)
LSETHQPGAKLTPWLRTAVTLALLSVLLVLDLVWYGFREEANRAVEVMGSGDTAALRDYILSYGAWAPIVSAALMVLQALAAFVPSFLLGLANRLAFGGFWGGMLSLVSAALAASISFGIARAHGRAPVEALVGRESLGRADGWFERYGAYAVLVARLIPVVSFDAISYAAGLTRMGSGASSAPRRSAWPPRPSSTRISANALPASRASCSWSLASSSPPRSWPPWFAAGGGGSASEG